jgi:hypothetical protein
MSRQILKLWLEFEEWDDTLSEQVRDSFNMTISLPDGREYALNVWTFWYAQQVPDELREEQSPPIFTEGPDLIVEVADRPTLERVAEKLVEDDRLKDEWLVQLPASRWE